MNGEANSMSGCHLSFIVPAHNEEALLAGTLESVKTAADSSGRSYEIVVVDDASTDGTAEIARAHDCRLVQVNLRQIAAVRNAGARQAAGQILVFVDADTILPPKTLAAAIDAIKSGAVGGGAKLAFHGRTPTWVHIILPFINFACRRARLAPGCFLFARKDAFEAISGFDERYFAAEEWVLSQALKSQGRFVMLREPSVTSARRGNPRDLLRTLGLLVRLLVRGKAALQRREGLELWYDSSQRAPVSTPVAKD
jgi:glycosyltransferase involved in cell wall biosynthesis